MALAGGADTDAGDGSMETILASIRRIIREDEAAGAPAPATPGADPASAPAEDEDDELLVLQPSMMVTSITAEEAAVSADAPLAGPSREAADLAAALFDDMPAPAPIPVVAAPPAVITALPAAAPVPIPAPPPEPVPVPVMLPRPTHSLTSMTEEPLLDPLVHAAAAQALATLQEAVRPAPAPPAEMRLLRSGGPTIEDLVRDELRGQLKLWLDANLPPMVERLVRQEIERLVRPA